MALQHPRLDVDSHCHLAIDLQTSETRFKEGGAERLVAALREEKWGGGGAQGCKITRIEEQEGPIHGEATQEDDQQENSRAQTSAERQFDRVGRRLFPFSLLSPSASPCTEDKARSQASPSPRSSCSSRLESSRTP
eukprot:746450-Hanusia_phi.AAC.1